VKQVIGFTAGARSDALEVVTMSNRNGALRSSRLCRANRLAGPEFALADGDCTDFIAR
jgi:hypothetical protein